MLHEHSSPMIMCVARELCQLRPRFTDICPTDSALEAMMNLICFMTDNHLKTCLNCSLHVLNNSSNAIRHSQPEIMIEIALKIEKTKGRDILVARPLLNFYPVLQEYVQCQKFAIFQLSANL